MKPSLKPSQDIANQLRWDERFDEHDFFVGFETRFDGLREMPLTHFLEHSEVPWHRVQYFRNTDGIQWDRRTRFDRIGNSGDSSAKAGDTASTGIQTMKAKDLINIGVPQGKFIGETLELIKTHPNRFEPSSLEFELRELLRDPGGYRGHFQNLALELSKPKPLARRETPAPYRVWGEGLEAGALQQMKNAVDLPVAVAGALMPDAHQGYGLPIGGVLAVENAVIPYAVGVDIACRMKLSVFDIPVDTAFKRRFEDLKRALETETRFGMGGGFERPPQHEVLDEDWNVTRVTLNDPDLGLEPGRYLALLSHSGSRGSGAAIAKRYSDLAMELHPELPKELKHLAWLEMNTEAGQEYWAAMNLMGLYAAANHAIIHKKIAKAVGSSVLAGVENHHNFCLPGHAIVPTPCGPKPMSDIRAGDHVYAWSDGEGLVPTRVTKHWQSGTKAICTIRTLSRELQASPEHPVLTVVVHDEPHPVRPWMRKGRGELVWKQAGDVRLGDILVCAEGYYDTHKTIGLGRARLIGAMLGDGWVRHRPTIQGYTVDLAIGDATQQHTWRYKELLEAELPSANWKVSARGAFGLTCSSAKVWRVLGEWGLHGYSLEKRVPRYVYSLSVAEKLELLAGYVDSDGSVSKNSKNHGRVLFASTNLGLITDLREIALSCGLQITPIISSLRKSNLRDAMVHRCSISADGGARLDLWHDSKRQNQRQTLRQRSKALQRQKLGYLTLPTGLFAQRVLSISASSLEQPVYDLSVEHASHSFICEGVVVHNCWSEEHVVNGAKRDLYVHRKGATPAGQGVLGVIPGSMATPGFVVRGKGDASSLNSASHGAGRAMSRTAAKERFNWKMVRPKLEAAGVTLLSAGIDENPFAYKDIDAVMNAQRDLVDVIARFDPRIVKMADDGTAED
jgi:tRNA-splicing ligase RtcB (3'-phosphate/5'-hydroxy nucleic acid ligase)